MKEDRKGNKKLLIFAIISLALIALFGFVFWKILRNGENEVPVENQIILEDKYKNTDGKAIDISKETDDIEGFINDLKLKKESFVIYGSLPVCSGETAAFKEYVTEFQKKNHLSFYYLTSDYIKDTSIYKTVKYYPSVLLYDKGELKTYLRFDSDEDAKYYKSLDGFSKWFKKNVKV